MENNSILPYATVMATVGAMAITFFREYVNFRLKLGRYKDKGLEENDVASAAPSHAQNTTPDSQLRDPKHVVNLNFQLLERYYSQMLNESRLNSRATIAVASIDFVVVLSGVGLALVGSVAVGVVSSVAGLVAEAATVLFFKNNQDQLKQVAEYHKKLVSTQYLLTAISLVETLDGSDVRNEETKRVITNLLYLSNELHGSRSPPLVGNAGTIEGSDPKKAIASAA